MFPGLKLANAYRLRLCKVSFQKLPKGSKDDLWHMVFFLQESKSLRINMNVI